MYVRINFTNLLVYNLSCDNSYEVANDILTKTLKYQSIFLDSSPIKGKKKEFNKIMAILSLLYGWKLWASGKGDFRSLQKSDSDGHLIVARLERSDVQPITEIRAQYKAA